MSDKNFDNLKASISHSITELVNTISDVLLPAFGSIASSLSNLLDNGNIEFVNEANDILFQRRDYESFLEWSNRISSQGLLDNHHYRWQYQKATFRWIVSPFVDTYNWIRGYLQ